MDTANIMEYFCLFYVSFIFFPQKWKRIHKLEWEEEKFEPQKKTGTLKPPPFPLSVTIPA